jgi:hypothetical protein
LKNFTDFYFVKYAQNLISENLRRTFILLKFCAVFIGFFLRLLALGYADDCRNVTADLCRSADQKICQWEDGYDDEYFGYYEQETNYVNVYE